MKKRIVWSIVGLVFGAMAIAGGLLKAGSTTPNSAVECGGKIMSPGDTCETTSKTGVKKVKTYEEQRQSNQGENYLVVGFGGLIMLISAWQLVKGLRAKKNAVPVTEAGRQTWTHQNPPPAQQWPAPPQQQWTPHHPAPQSHPAPPPQPAPQPQSPQQPTPQPPLPHQAPPPQPWPTQQAAPQPSQPSQEWLQQTATTRIQPPPQPQQEWDPSQSFGPTGEIPQDQPPHQR